MLEVYTSTHAQGVSAEVCSNYVPENLLNFHPAFEGSWFMY
jgi:hypothetical protein